MVEEIKQLTIKLVPLIEKYKQGKVSGDDLESLTSQIISHDKYEETDPIFQECIELLDTWDIQNFSEKDLSDLSDKLRAFIK
jgi:hypothetical protein